MQPQNLKTNLLGTEENQAQSAQTEKKIKKRMTSIKHPVSQYKNVLTKIFSNYHPIKDNSNLDKNCQAQVGFLYIGGCGVVQEETLKKYDIKAVVTVLEYKKYDKQNLGQRMEDIFQIQQHQYIDMSDDHPDIGPYLNHSYDFISEYLSSGFNLLVHSNEGLCRAPAIVINYLMRKYRMGFEEVHKIVKERKPEICINENLQRQLRKLKY